MVALASAAVAVAAGWLLLGRARTLPPATSDAVGSISIIVPARDEAHSIEACLRAIAQLVPAPAEVVVVDDGSTDATADLARSLGVRVVPAPEPPAGWIGKSWACSYGAERSSGALLLFLDADVVLAPDALARLVHAHAGGLLSVQPYHRTHAAYESLSAPFNLVSALGSGAFARWVGARAPSVAFGPCLLTSRADYDAVGGHAAVAGEIVEDIALARRYRALDRPVECRVGAGVVEFRMYPGGLGQLVEGWTKNLAGGARTAQHLPVVLAVASVVAALAVAGAVVSGPSAPSIAAYAAVALATGVALRRLGRFRWWTWALYPVPLFVFVAVFARSLWRTYVRRSVTWRGRTIVLGGTELVSESGPLGPDSLTRTEVEAG